MNEEDDFPPLKIHPKKTAEQIGTLAAKSNSWYENENDESSGSEDELELEVPFPNMKLPAPIIVVDAPKLTVGVPNVCNVDCFSAQENQRSKKLKPDDSSIDGLLNFDMSLLKFEASVSKLYKVLQFTSRLRKEALVILNDCEKFTDLCNGCHVKCSTYCSICCICVCASCCPQSISIEDITTSNTVCTACAVP